MEEDLLEYLTGITGIQPEEILQIVADVDSHYSRYHIRQGRKLRQIEEPHTQLKNLQKALVPIYEDNPFHDGCMARRGLSTRDNAERHTGAKHLLKVDISGCYQAIRPHHATRALTKPLQIAALDLCFCRGNTGYEMLPTGAPTSPVLCNIALTPIDQRLSRLAAVHGYVYTRYLDDMIFTTKAQKRNWEILPESVSILKEYGFKANKSKTKWRRYNLEPLDVTGLSVGPVVALPRKVKRQLRAMVHKIVTEGRQPTMEEQGYLAYTQGVDRHYYENLIAYQERLRDELQVA